MGQAFLRSFVEEQRLYFQEQRTSNDLLFTFLAIVTAKNIEILDEVLIHQRRDNQNSLSNTREQSWTCFYEALLELREELKKEDSIMNWSRTISIMHCIFRSGIWRR